MKYFLFTIDLFATLWKNDSKITTWSMPKKCSPFTKRYNTIQHQLKTLCSRDDFVMGLLSKEKGQILRVSAIFNALLPYRLILG